jgi:hypothetical protein
MGPEVTRPAPANIPAEPRIRAAVTSTVEVVTPELARFWLEHHNKINRPVRSKKVAEYGRQMVEKEFLTTGEPIIFDWDEQMVNGQHRLLALVETGLTLTFVVVRGVDPAVRDVVDTGIKRTLGDTLKLHGEQNHNNLAASIGWYWRYSEGLMRWPNVRPSNLGALALLAEHPGLRESVAMGSRIRRVVGGSVGLYAALCYVFETIDRQTCQDLIGQIATGTLLQPGDPAFAFRRFMTNAVTKSSKPSAVYVGALLVKTWNLTRQGRQIQTLAWRPASGEPFPVAK